MARPELAQREAFPRCAYIFHNTLYKGQGTAVWGARKFPSSLLSYEILDSRYQNECKGSILRANIIRQSAHEQSRCKIHVHIKSSPEVSVDVFK
eukprot:g11555.t1